ncbi:hypothetical protein Tco_0603048 [Tanacetum coccineum]
MATNEETYDQPLAMTITNIFEVNYEDAYDSDVDEAIACAIKEMHHEELLDSDCIDTSSASNAIFEINKLRQQLQGKRCSIRNLRCSDQHHEGVNVVPLKLDGLKVENVSLKRRYDELSKANTHSRTAYTEKINALTAEIAKLKTELSGKKRVKPTSGASKTVPKRAPRNHSSLPVKSVNARRAADHNRKLNVVDHNQFVIRSLKSVNTKTPQAKHSVNHTKQVWKATRNHNVNTTKTAWRPTRKVVGSVKPQWKPTGRYFALYDNCPLTRIMEPIVEPLELTPSVSSSSKVTMISRFTDCKLSDRKAGSKGLSGIFEC